MTIAILGAGLSGISVAYHLENKYEIYEKNLYSGGHIHSEYINGFTWDEGPHVSFTKNQYVKELFEYNTDNELLEYPVKTGNYFQGSWIPHPAQANLYAVPSPLREACLKDFLDVREKYTGDFSPNNYEEWLYYSFGKTFTNIFPSAYTRKYWTIEPASLTTKWVGDRVFFPNIDQVKKGYLAPLESETHYIQKIRYPNKGGYVSFAKKMLQKIKVNYEHDLANINFNKKTISYSNGKDVLYDKLISTIPLPILIERSNAPIEIKEAAKLLSCSSVLLVNVTANHTTQRTENWIYVYDEDKYSTRINCTELLSPNNAPNGKTGIQVEVYFSKYRGVTEKIENIAKSVCTELIEMGLIKSEDKIENVFTKWVQWANVIFDHKREEALDKIYNWLNIYGMYREKDDLDPMTDWEIKFKDNSNLGDIIMAGRFAQWKYYWTDDCVLRGKFISGKIN